MASWFGKRARKGSDTTRRKADAHDPTDARAAEATARPGCAAPRPPLMLALEPRMMFDASVPVVADAAADATHADAAATDGSTAPADDAHAAVTPVTDADDPPAANENAPAPADAASPSLVTSTATLISLAPDGLLLGQSGAGAAVVVIDASVSNADTLVAALPAGTEVIRLTADSNGLDQIAAALAGHSGLGSIQIVSEGASGALRLGNGLVDQAALDAHAASLAAIGATLAADGDILLYGCKAAEGSGGRAFVDDFARLTGADVAASTDWTGAAALGGNWTLEYASGDINHGQLLDAASAASYDHLLTTLLPGDIAVIGWGAANGTFHRGEITIAALVDVAAGSTITITDIGWVSGSVSGHLPGFPTNLSINEGRITWTLGSTLQAGDIVRITIYDGYVPDNGANAGTTTLYNVTDGAAISSAEFTRSGWTGTGASANVFRNIGDSVLIYQGADTSPTFVFGVNVSEIDPTIFPGASYLSTDGSGWNPDANPNTSGTAVENMSALPTTGTGTTQGLVNGTSAVGFPLGTYGATPYNNNNFQYTGATSAATRDTWLARFGDRSNWTGADTGGGANAANVAASNSFASTSGTAVTLLSANVAPTLTLDSGSTSYTENASATVVSGGASAGDADGNWNSGTVRLSLGANGATTDVLGIGASGGITVSGTTVSYGGTAIGTLSAATGSLSGSTVTGSASSALLVTLNGSATDAAVQALVRAFTFANSSDDPGSATRTVTVTVADALNASTSASRSIAVTPTNDAPTDITLSNTTVAENSGTPATVGTLGTTDPDSGNTFTYTIVGGADQASFDISGSSLRFASGTTLDYEVKNSYSVTVRSTDQGGQSTDKTFTVTLSNVNEAPVLTVPATVNVVEGSARAITGVSVSDPDAGSASITFSLIAASGVFHGSTGGGVTVVGDGSNGISLSGSQADINALLAAGGITYTGDSGSGGSSVAMIVQASDGGNSGSGGVRTASQLTSLSVGLPNAAPVFALDSGSASFTENGSAVAVSTGTTVSDAEGNWNGGSVTITLTANGDASDVLALDTSGSVALAGTTVSVGGTVIGTLSAGSGTLSGAEVSGSATASLVITLNASATDADAQALVRALTFGNSGDNPGSATRTLSVTVADNAGGSTTHTRDVTVTPVNDAPTASGGSYSLTATDEDTASTPVTVASLLGHFTTADADGDTLGIAVTAASGNGHWQYSTDGSTWTNLGSASAGAAVLLDSTTQLRYLGDGIHGETATPPAISFVAWDRSTGSASVNGTPATADTTTGGGPTAFSTGTLGADISVSEVNDAPVLTDTTLGLTLEENSGAPVGAVGSSLADFMGGISDVDGDSPLGVALTSSDETLGTWYYTTDNGSTWTAVGAVSETSALLLANDGNTRLFFQTSAGVTGTTSAALGLHAWDGTEGSAGSRVDLTNATTYTSNASVTIPVSGSSGPASLYPTTINVAGVGTITDVSVTLTGLTHTFAGDLDILLVGPDGQGVILMSDIGGRPSGTNLTFSDSAASAITSATASGTFRPANQGLSADSFTGVSGSFGTSLSVFSGGSINGNWQLYIVDDTGGDVGTLAGWSLTLHTGPSSAFSSNTDTVSVTVTEVPQAPVLTPAAPAFTGITEDDSSNAGQTVADLLGGNVSDGNAGAVQGIAITGLDAGHGSWEYSLDGTSWTAVGSVSDSAALLLRASDHLRFVPDGVNADAASLTYRAWDQSGATAGLEGTTADTTTNGGRSAFSTATDTATIAVSDVNDAPTLTAGTSSISDTDEDTASPPASVLDLLTLSGWSDADTAALGGIAITGLHGNGSWQFSTDSGSTWTDIGSVSAGSAALFDSATQLRYQPDGLNGEAVSIDFVAWDRTTGSASSAGSVSTADASSGGGTTAFSTQTATVRLTVNDVNDAPALATTTITLAGTDEDAASAAVTVADLLADAGVTDADTGALGGIAVTALGGNGAWQFSTDSGATWTDIGSVSTGAAALFTSATQLRYQPDGHNGETASLSFTAWDTTHGIASSTGSVSTADAGTGGGSSAFSTATATASLAVSDINDAPTLDHGSTSLAATDEDTASAAVTVTDLLADAGLADVDAGALGGLAVTGLTGNGTWQFSTDSGATWTDIGSVSASAAALFDATTRLRYQPDGIAGETATISFVAWDRTTGSASTAGSVSTADASAGGGTTAFSATTTTASLGVTDVNDAPTLDSTRTPGLAATDEDTPGSTLGVADLVTGSAGADADGDSLGIAITSTSGLGGWQYSTDSGATWTGFGSVSDGAALLLGHDTVLRYLPDGSHGEAAGAAGFSYRLWDATSGSASVAGTPATADTTSHGGTTAFSADTLTLAVGAIADVNDAPTLASGSAGISDTDENTPADPVGVSDLLTLVGGNDADSGALGGIAVTGLHGNGSWQFSTDSGSTWTDIGSVSAGSAALFDSATQLRYLPDGSNGEAVSIDFVAWDRTTGSASTSGTVSTADTSSAGGSSSFSATAATVDLTVHDVNDAPTLATATLTLAGTGEDTASSAVTVADLLADAGLADVDAGALGGIAVAALTGNGSWQFSTDSGATWTDIGSVSAGSAALFSSATQLRYQPDGSNGETASISFAAWDRSTGTASSSGAVSTADAGTRGGERAFSTTIATASLAVSDVNDAPTLGTTTLTLAGTDEDTASAAVIVADLLADAGLADVDAGALGGIAVTALTGNGSWQFSTDSGATWTDIGTVSAGSAALFSSATQLRYQPDGVNGETASLSFVAWDRTTGTASATGSVSTADTTANGGSTAFSAETSTASLAVSDVNDAPTLGTTTLTLAGTDEDTASAAVTVADLLADAGLADVDAGALGGIAVTALTGNGSWQFSTDSGATWTDIGGVNAGNAALFTSATQLRYQPDSVNGETASLSFAAWDRSAGSASTAGSVSHADTATRGGSSAFSTASVTASLAVSDVNDAPTLGATTLTLPGTDEDTASAAVTVADLLADAGLADGDADALGGIAITALTGNGSWQFSTDGGATWTDIGSVSTGNAALFTSATQLRYQPDGVNGETASLSFAAWDRSTGSASSSGAVRTADAGTRGGSSAFSMATATASLTVADVNDAPTLGATTLTLPGTDEDTASVAVTVTDLLADAGLADVDASALGGIAITALAGHGSWQFSTDSGATWTDIGGVSAGSAALFSSATQLRYVPDGSNGESASISFAAWDRSTGTASTSGAVSTADTATRGGDSAFSTATATASLAVNGVNDAPTLATTTLPLPGTDEDTTSAAVTVADLLADAGLADVDAGALGGIAVTALAGHGSWQFSTDSGATWTDIGSVSASHAALFTSTTQLRYLPDGSNGETASIGFAAWDRSTGSASTAGSVSHADTATRGGSSAFSTATATASLAVSDVNDAPTLGATTLTLPGTDEDTASAVTVADLLADAGLADVDAGAIGGIAVTALSGNGTWQFSTDSGATWTAIGGVSAGNAALFSSATQLRYLPDGSNGESASISFAAWDRSAGTASTAGSVSHADTATRGDSSAFSTATATASLAVSDVNDAPTLATTTLTLAGTDEDTTSAAVTVADLLADAGLADVDAGALGGIAVTALSGNGTWQFSTDSGATWTAVGSVSTGSAALFGATTQLRYVPDALHGETASLGFAAWDRSTGSASTAGHVSHADASTRGGSTAFSAAVATASLDVSEVNDLPTLTTTAGSTAFTEAGGAVVIDSGITLADIDGQPTIVSATVAITGGRAAGDVLGFGNDGATMGDIAASWNAGSGRLTLSSAGGATLAQWQAALRAVSFDNGSALVADGARTVSFSVTDANGDSSASVTRDLTVTAVDQPASFGNLPSAAMYMEGDDPTVLAPGVTVLDPESAEGGFDGASVTLVNHDGADARDVFGATGTLGALTEGQALVVGGVTVGTVSRNSGGMLVLDFSGANATRANVEAVLRQIGYSNASDAPPGFATIDWSFTPAHGSGATGSTDISLISVNDTTAFTGGGTATAIDDTGSLSPFEHLVVADPDTQGATVSITLTDALGAGDFSAGTSGWTRSVSGNDIIWTRTFASTDNIGGTIQAALRDLVFTPAANALPSGTTRAIGFGVTVDDGGGTPVSVNATTLTVSPVNDAPMLDGDSSFALPSTDEDTPSIVSVADLLAGAGARDADAGTALGLAITFTSGRGQWQYSTDSGATWHSVGAVSADAALTLGQYGLLRYTPDGIEADLASISFVAWDASDGTLTDGATRGAIDATAHGAGSAVSATTAVATLSVTDVNDAPTLVVPDRISLDEDGSVVITGIELRDVDGDRIVTIASGGATPLAVTVPGPVSVSFSVASGSLTAAPGDGVTITTAADGTVTLTGQLTTLNAWLAAGNLSYTGAPNANGEVALSVRFDDGGNIGGGSLVATAEVVLDIAAVNDAPTVTAPADADVGEGLSVSFGSATGNAIALADIDAGSGLLRLTLTATHGTLTLGSLAGISFISGDGTADASLVIEGSLASLRAALDGLVFSPAAGYHGAASIGLVLSDLGNSGSGGALVADTSIDIAVSAAPRATGVSLVGDDNGYKAGDTVLIEVDYDSALVLDTTGGSPTLALNVGGTTRLATLVSSDGGRLVFGYTVLAGDSTADLALAGSNALSLNGATLRNATGSNAVLALPTPSGSGPLDGGTPVVVDGIAPVVTSVTLPADGLYGAGNTLDFTVNLSEAVTLDTSGGTPRIAVSIGGTTVYATYVGGSGGSALGFRLVLPAGVSGDGISLAGNLDFNGATVRDALGNPADPALHGVGAAAITIDGQAPTAGAPTTGTAGPTNATSLDFTVVFDEAVSGVDAADFTVRATGSASGSITGVRSTDGGKTWIVTVAAGGDGTLAVDLDASGTGITDAAGNAVSGGATGTPVAVDHGLPTVDAITLLDAQTTSGGTLRFELHFSEGVSGLDLADLALVLGDSATGRITGLTQVDASTWVVTVEAAGNGSVALRVVAAGSGITDAAGNALAADVTSPAYTHTEAVVPVTPPAPPPAPAPVPAPLVPVSSTPVVLPVTTLPTDSSIPVPPPAFVPPPPAPRPTDNGIVALSFNPALDQPLAARPFSGSFSIGAARTVSFGIPDGSFVVRDAQAQLTLSARQSNGQPLPAWLRFDPATGRFSGTVPPGLTGRVRIQVTLRDSQGHMVSTEIEISLGSTRAALPAEADQLALAALLGDLAARPDADRDTAPADRHMPAGSTPTQRASAQPPRAPAEATAHIARAPLSHQLDRHGDAGFADELAALLGAITRL